MNDLPNCPKCECKYTYEDANSIICPECFYEFSLNDTNNNDEDFVVKDANGTILQDGDDVALIKNLKVKGAKSDLKIGTKVKGIKLVDLDHNIDCKIKDFGKMALKSEFVKKI